MSTTQELSPRLRVLTKGAADDPVVVIEKGNSTIGRSSENRIVLHDSLVSRQHAEIIYDGAKVQLRDLGGKNPVRVNGKDVQNYQLLDGDRISIGQTELVFESGSEEGSTPLRVVQDGERDFETGVGGISLDAATVVFDRPDLSGDPEIQKSYDRLSSLYQLSENIFKVHDEEGLYDFVLSTSTQQTGAERGFLGLPEEGREDDPYALNIVRFWDPEHGDKAETLEMSETILRHIQRDRKAVLVRDVPGSQDFGMSVIDLKIRSFICVPIIHDDRFLGLIYVDTRGSGQQFGRSDLEFVSAIGRIAGLKLHNLRIQAKLLRENEQLRSLVGGSQEIIGSSEAMETAFRLIEKVAPRDTSVLVFGENGTGKELVARAIHEQSPRKASPFVAVNCGAIPPNLVESELFGYEKGAFTGAQQQTEGKFDLANGGTLFLDEIGEMSLDMQVKILRALQERKFYRVGGKKEVSVDIRVISATNRDLKKAIEDGLFREDLYFRLAVVTIEVPPLRDRGDDLMEIASHFLNQGSNKIQVTKAARDCLLKYEWPGNIRELRNALEQAVILGDGKRITPADLPSHIGKTGRGRMTFVTKPLAEVEKQHILRVLDETG
ncbi:MAG: sigma 54-interacting transcriptional regulator, partial [Planctomycetota bacterium]